MTIFRTKSIVDARVRLPSDLRPTDSGPALSAHLKQYGAVLGLDPNGSTTLADLEAEMSSSGIEHAVVHAEYEFGDPADALNEAVARLIEKKPHRFSGFGTISMEQFRPMRAVRQVQRAAEMGHIGVNFQPSFFGLPMDERRYYPVYAKAAELGLVVALHTGINYSTVHPIKNDRPLALDQVACDFPELTLVACHAGWPWVAEMVAVARKHPNVLVDFGGLAPKYLGAQGSGWEVMYRFMNSLLKDQVLFATDWPVFPMKRAVEEWRGLGLKPEVLSAALYENAGRLLSRDKEREPAR